MYEFWLILTVVTAFFSFLSILLGYKRNEDPFHPLIYISGMFLALYGILPLSLFFTDTDNFKFYLSVPQLEYIQTLNLLGFISIWAGILSGDRGLKVSHHLISPLNLSQTVKNRIKRAAILLGLLGIAGFSYGIINVGGISATYGESYGRGYGGGGYVNQAFSLTIPAFLWIMVSCVDQKIKRKDWFWIILFASPYLMHGLLGARRGPTFAVIAALFVGWYMTRFRRPPLRRVVMGGVALGMLVLTLVLNRGAIYLGSDLQFESSPTEYFQTARSANAYIYGAGTILHADARGNYYWGRRYFVQNVIRPIPRALWPSQYKDVSEWLNIPSLAGTNAGTLGSEFEETLGWQGSTGASPGIIADIWIEFWWFSFPILFLIGRAYGVVWYKAVYIGAYWIPIYTLMSAFSVYLIAQSVGAMLLRFLLTAFAAMLVWRYASIKVYNHRVNDI